MKINRFARYIKENEDVGHSQSDERYPRPRTVEKGNPHVIKMAQEKVGDGDEPNMFFVMASNDYLFLNKETERLEYYWDDPKAAPIKIEDHILRETFGPFQTFEEAKKKVDEIELDENIGPRRVTVDDRLQGPGLYEKVMKANTKIFWQEEERGQ